MVIQDMDPNDLDLFNKFLPSGAIPILRDKGEFEGQIEEEQQQGTNLADLILEKIAAHESTQQGEPPIQGGGPQEDAVELPAKVVEIYSKYVHSPMPYRTQIRN